MITGIKQFFDRFIDPSTHPAPADKQHALKIATAALLLEVMRMDSAVTEAERSAIASALQRQFDLDASEFKALMALADQEARQANDYYQFTSLINKSCDLGEKVRIIENMWLVAMADAHLDAHELHLIRKIADLLYIGHGDYVAAKQRAREASGFPAQP